MKRLKLYSRKEIIKIFFVLYFISVGYFQGVTQNNEVNNTIQQYENVEDAGFHPSVIEKVRMIYDSSDLSSLFVLSEGNVLITLGDNTRRFMTHSIRKSFLSALFGIYIDRGIIDASKTLAELGIDDKNTLTSEEKKATILDLLSARSGIYLPAAYSPRGMEENLPARGSHLPGSHWYYNNWDFNTLSTIFEKETGMGIFEAFDEEIAQPLGMKDFRISDGHYRYEKEKSDHPAYLFNMSSRDMALFGQLYVQNGEWKGQQIISKDWIRQSTSKVSTDLGRFSNREGYGLLWWVSDDYFGHKMYYASGSGGHRIMVFPEDNLVMVTRVNTFEGKLVSQDQIGANVRAILRSKTEHSVDNPTLIPYSPEAKMPKVHKVELADLEKYSGDYLHPFLGIFSIQISKGNPTLTTSIGSFNLYPIGDDQLYPEDLQTIIEMKTTADLNKRQTVEPVYDKNRQLLKAIFYY